MEKITSENCSSIMGSMPYSGDIPEKSNAWGVVYNFCCQNGMKPGKATNGITNVIRFLESLISTRPDQITATIRRLYPQYSEDDVQAVADIIGNVLNEMGK